MKIAIIGDALDLQYAGIHIYTKELIQNLAKIDQKNEYLLLRPKLSQNEFSNIREIETVSYTHLTLPTICSV